MSTADWEHLTQLPRRVIGSLGPEKADLEVSGDYTYRTHAVEENLIRDWDGFLAEAVGLPVGYAAGSIQGRLDALEASAGDFMTDPDRYYYADNFDQASKTAPDPRYWSAGGVDIPGLCDDPPGIEFLHHGADPGELLAAIERLIHKKSHQLHMRFRVLVDDAMPAGSQLLIRFATTDGWTSAGVAFRQVDSKIKGIRLIDGAGATAETDVGTWTQDTSHLVHLWLDAAGKLWVSIDGAAGVDCGVVFGDYPNAVELWGPYDAVGTGRTVVSAFRLWSDWTPV